MFWTSDLPLRFSDTDASGYAHFSALLQLVEQAEHEWFAEAGVLLNTTESGFPRRHVEVDFMVPVLVGSRLFITLRPTFGETSLNIEFSGRSKNPDLNGPEQPCFRGKMVIVHCR
ncbi:MAG: acyl-CoA thioesterase, partial [Verrucomicrobiales bacterium]